MTADLTFWNASIIRRLLTVVVVVVVVVVFVTVAVAYYTIALDCSTVEERCKLDQILHVLLIYDLPMTPLLSSSCM